MTQRTRKKKNSSSKTALSMVQYEIMVIAVLAFALFIMVSIYFNGGGIIGTFFRDLFFGMLGIAAYILPIGLFVSALLKAFNKGNQRLDMIILLSLTGIMFFSVVAHVIYVEYSQLFIRVNEEASRSFLPTLSLYYTIAASEHVAGGLVGGLVGDILLELIGKVATILVLIVIYLSIFVGITEKSVVEIGEKLYSLFLVGTKKIIEWMSDIAQKTMAKRKAERLIKEQHALEQRELRQEQLRVQKQQEAEVEAQATKVMEEEIPAQESVQKAPHKKIKNKKNIASLIKATLTFAEDEAVEEVVEAPTDSDTPIEVLTSEEYQELEGADQEELEEIKEPEEEKLAFQEEYVEEKAEIEDDSAIQPKRPVQPNPPVQQKVAKPVEAEEPVNSTQIEQEILAKKEEKTVTYIAPPIDLLKPNPMTEKEDQTSFLQESATKLEETLASFGVSAKVIDVSVGPSVTRYELQPAQGVKVSKIVNLTDDIALNLAASGIRMEAPIPGKSAVGIEVPNKEQSAVYFREVIDSEEFNAFPSKVAFGLGKDISGEVMVTDIGRMPHLLIAGATGSGKSVCINTLITSILYKSSPEDVKLLMIDPKVVELSIYNGIPHLLIPVVTDPKKAAGALNWAVQEMLERYKLFAAANVRDVKSYNKMVEEKGEMKKLPQIVIIVDELADLMVAAAGDVEEAICRLAQMARAAGLHLIIATQRPSVDVITGLIKANIPSRIAFNVSSGIDSRTILDMNGAEKLLGKGDMLFYPVGYQKPVRIQGAFISDGEVESIVEFLKARKKEEYDEKIMNQLNRTVSEEEKQHESYDEIFEEALELCVKKQKASASMIQRTFRVGYNRAARILDQLHEAGYVGDDEGSKPRKMLMTEEEFEALKAKANGEENVEYQEETIENTLDEAVNNERDEMVEESAETSFYK